ncbi:hypothetical protein H0E87_023587 [Populus deltoides]|uniref:Uncharacterized protein n=1 Tax=Populus deltoides TaxID=3696 RepID=A0A8T2XHL2_POPDE|nr:hypothetical protein H0E87_023587 [Populus deltoides]
MEEQGKIVPTFKTMAARICSPVYIDMVISILATTGQSPSFQTYSSTWWADTESSQQLPRSNNIDIWKYAGFSANHKGTEVVRKCQPHMVKNDQSSESSGNSNLANRAVKTQEEQH